MQNLQSQKKKLFEAIAKGSIAALIEIIDIIPIYGPLLSKVISITLSGIDYYETNKKEAILKKDSQDKNCKLNSLQIQQNELKENLTTIENIITDKIITQEDFMKILKHEMIVFFKENDVRIPVYMDGIMLLPRDGEIIDTETLDEMEDLFRFEQKYEWAINLLKSIKAFIDNYFIEEYDCFFNPEGLIIYFDKRNQDYRWPPRRNDEEIIEFIHNINLIFEEQIFVDYIII